MDEDNQKKSNPAVDAAKNAAKEQAKEVGKKILLKIAPYILAAVGIIIGALAFFAVIMAVKDSLVEIGSKLTASSQGFWRWLTDDYWTKLDQEIDITYVDNSGNTVTATSTLTDHYIRQLNELGVSLKELKLLGNFEFTGDEQKLTEREKLEKILNDPNYSVQKAQIEKYITAFLKADMITQQPHRRRGEELVSPTNEYWIDGGIYIYRTVEKDSSGNAMKVSDTEYVKTVEDNQYVQMQYLDYDKFNELVSKNDSSIRYKYTIDPSTGEMKIAQLKTIEKTKSPIYSIGSWFENIPTWMSYTDPYSKETIIEDVISVDYKSYAAKYTMPYELLINLCQVTQNPEFVYHVAQLALDTKIMLVVQDDTTVETVVTETEKNYTSYKNKGSSSTAGATKTGTRTDKEREVVVSTTMNPHIEIKFANTWSFYENYEFSKTINETVEQNGPTFKYQTVPSRLPDKSYNPITKKTTWSGTFLTSTTTATQTTTTITTYNPGVLKNSVEKSKQFLGLLRNKDGKCPYDCYTNTNQAKYCAEKAVFERDGINVPYRIPNATRTETPLNKLISGKEMFFSLLGQDYENDEEKDDGDANVITNEVAGVDAQSQYVSKMQGILDHMKYLLTFPENEEDIKLDDGEIIDPEEPEEPEEPDEPINVEEIIVKTDEEGALRPVEKDELIAVITATFSGKERENALSIVDTLIECQDKYKVNAIFVLAFAHQETHIGTIGDYIDDNNWLSWKLGTVYASPQANVETVMRNMATGKIYFTQGKYTIEEIGYTFCPNLPPKYPTQGDAWVENTTAYVKKMYAELGITIEKPEPGIGIEDGDTYTVNGRTYINYKQDSGAPWSSNKFYDGTMKDSGCSITCVAIVLKGYGVDVTPETIRKGIEEEGKTRNLLTILENYGVSGTRPGRKLTASDIKNNLQSGKPVIVNVNGEWTSSTGHYMVLLDYRNENGKEQVYVSNPGTVTATKNGWVDLSRITNNMKTMSILITQD